jgi:hypothetical protein
MPSTPIEPKRRSVKERKPPKHEEFANVCAVSLDSPADKGLRPRAGFHRRVTALSRVVQMIA